LNFQISDVVIDRDTFCARTSEAAVFEPNDPLRSEPAIKLGGAIATRFKLEQPSTHLPALPFSRQSAHFLKKKWQKICESLERMSNGNGQDFVLSDLELKAAVRLEEDEILFFRDLFELAAGKGVSVLYGNVAKGFLSRSGLSTTALREIWNICDRGRKGHLTRPEFVLAARLVALGQV
jgi:hypothetical protein